MVMIQMNTSQIYQIYCLHDLLAPIFLVIQDVSFKLKMKRKITHVFAKQEWIMRLKKDLPRTICMSG